MPINREKLHSIIIWLLSISAALLFLHELILGIDYFLTPELQRPRHDLHRDLRPAGFRSHGWGIAGSVLMILLALYPLRKRLKFMRKWGSLRWWLNYHIFMGFAGPAFIILHSTLKFNGIIAISFWSMIIVMASGVLGRFIYLNIPHSRDGEDLSINEIEHEQLTLQQMLPERFERAGGMVENFLLEEFNYIQLKTANLVKDLIRLLIMDFRHSKKTKQLGKRLIGEYKFTPSETKKFVRLLHEQISLEKKKSYMEISKMALHDWHLFHLPFAWSMGIIMFIHIGIAIYTGATWIF